MTTIARSPLDSGRTAVHDAVPGFDVERVRADFPILREKARGHQLVYLDNAATSQKPKVVMDAIVRYYEHDNANIHRGVHYLSERATEEFEEARKSVQNVPSCRSAQRDYFCARRNRRDQPGRANLWPGSCGRR